MLKRHLKMQAMQTRPFLNGSFFHPTTADFDCCGCRSLHLPQVRSFPNCLAHTYPIPRAVNATLASYLTGDLVIAGWITFATACIFVAHAIVYDLTPQLRFIWHCFLRPIGVADQRTRLDKVRKSSDASESDHQLQYRLVLRGPGRSI